ncbi:GGDEF domain-containing protein [Rhizobium rhizosphaerae]|nr:GGDEF domain-containing protein [Xaviernesmea rhizosphaerae]
MQASLSTLYAIGVGTLTMAVIMTVWEQRFHPARSRALRFWAAGYAILLIGILILIARDSMPRVLGYGVANLFIVTGYALVAAGSLPFAGWFMPRRLALAAIPAAPLWLTVGPLLPTPIWHAISGLFIASICVIVAIAFLRPRLPISGRADRLVAIVFAMHAAVYLLRVPLVPLVSWLGNQPALDLLALSTMFEGVLFSMAAPMALLSLAREESRAQLQRVSETDFLTGLDNRRAFFGKAETVRGARAQLVLFDLDHFKSINDRYGHDAGDEVLRIFARAVRGQLGPKDLIARLGGEEFAALMPDATSEEALARLEAVARRLRLDVRSQTALQQDVTFSAGLLTVTGSTSMTAALSGADRLLYRAKANGRNRVERPHPLFDALGDRLRAQPEAISETAANRPGKAVA